MVTVFDRVQKVISNQLKISEDRVVPTASLVDDLRADSLDFVDLGMALEEEFEGDVGKIELDDKDWERVTGKSKGYTVADILDVLADKGIVDPPES